MDYKMNNLTYDALLSMYAYLCDGRVFLAKEKLEEILGLENNDRA